MLARMDKALRDIEQALRALPPEDRLQLIRWLLRDLARHSVMHRQAAGSPDAVLPDATCLSARTAELLKRL